MSELAHTNLSTPTPEMVLNVNDKIYLSVAYKYEQPLHYVYMLVCRKDTQGTGYYAFAETDIATFKGQDAATVFVETVRQAANYQKKSMPKLYDMFMRCNSGRINNFKQNVK